MYDDPDWTPLGARIGQTLFVLIVTISALVSAEASAIAVVVTLLVILLVGGAAIFLTWALQGTIPASRVKDAQLDWVLYRELPDLPAPSWEEEPSRRLTAEMTGRLWTNPRTGAVGYTPEENVVEGITPGCWGNDEHIFVCGEASCLCGETGASGALLFPSDSEMVTF